MAGYNKLSVLSPANSRVTAGFYSSVLRFHQVTTVNYRNEIVILPLNVREWRTKDGIRELAPLSTLDVYNPITKLPVHASTAGL